MVAGIQSFPIMKKEPRFGWDDKHEETMSKIPAMHLTGRPYEDQQDTYSSA